MTIDAVSQVISGYDDNQGGDQHTNPAAVNDTPKAPVQNETDPNKARAEDGEDDNEDGDEDDNAPWPKKAENAVSRYRKDIGKLRQREAALKQQVSEYQRQLAQYSNPNGQQQAAPAQNAAQNNQSQKGADQEPREEDYDNFGEFLKAVAQHEAKKQFAGETERNRIEQQNQQVRQHYAQRETVIAERSQSHAQSIPDFTETMEAYADYIDSFPPQIEALFLDADDGAMAFYNLAKEGKLENLPNMTLQQIAFEIGRAQHAPSESAQAQQPSVQQNNAQQQRPVSNAPAPMSATKGTGSNQKSVENMSADELLNLVKNRS